MRGWEEGEKREKWEGKLSCNIILFHGQTALNHHTSTSRALSSIFFSSLRSGLAMDRARVSESLST